MQAAIVSTSTFRPRTRHRTPTAHLSRSTWSLHSMTCTGSSFSRPLFSFVFWNYAVHLGLSIWARQQLARLRPMSNASQEQRPAGRGCSRFCAVCCICILHKNSTPRFKAVPASSGPAKKKWSPLTKRLSAPDRPPHHVAHCSCSWPRHKTQETGGRGRGPPPRGRLEAATRGSRSRSHQRTKGAHIVE